jgi:signal transduction histidine kinase
VLNFLKKFIKIEPNLSLQGFLLYSPISTLGFPVSVLIANENASLLFTLFYGVLLTISTFLIYFLQILFINKFISNYLILAILFFFVPVVTGLFRGFIFFVIVETLNLEQPSNLTNRLISSTVTTLFWLTLANYVMAVSRRFLIQYQSALNQYLRQLKNSSKSTSLSVQNVSMLNSVQINLFASVEAYIGKNDPASFRKLSAVLVQQINDQIRPLSRRIWIKELSQFPTIKFWQLLKDSVNSLSFSWRKFILLITGLSVLGNLAIRSTDETFWRTFSFLIAISLIRVIYDRTRFFPQIQKTLLNLILLLVFGLFPVLVSEFFVDSIGYSGNWSATLIISPVAPVLMLILTLLRLANRDRNLILEILSNSSIVLPEDNPADIEIESASVASYLHNSLQSELLALSKQLEEAAKNPDSSRSAELLQRVSSTVNRSITDDFVRFNESPKDRLQAVLDSWLGILEIQLNFSLDLLINNEKASIIVQTIEEVATNVSRYGNATALSVSAEFKLNSVVLSLQSNGVGKLKRSKGFGTAWFNQVALSQWQIIKNETGSLLIIEL